VSFFFQKWIWENRRDGGVIIYFFSLFFPLKRYIYSTAARQGMRYLTFSRELFQLIACFFIYIK
jgi:hypothetical protein